MHYRIEQYRKFSPRLDSAPARPINVIDMKRTAKKKEAKTCSRSFVGKCFVGEVEEGSLTSMRHARNFLLFVSVSIPDSHGLCFDDETKTYRHQLRFKVNLFGLVVNAKYLMLQCNEAKSKTSLNCDKGCDSMTCRH